MLFDRGFATLDEFKARLGISDAGDDTLMTEILRSTASLIEMVAGRPLRRRHGRTEILSGGQRTIRLGVEPIAQVHRIRESASRDFVDSDNYTDLVEGTDFIREAGGGGRPGDTGVLRRLGGSNWLGDELDNAGQIEVVFTGGYKTDDEVELENGTATINSLPSILDYGIKRQLSLDYDVVRGTIAPLLVVKDSTGLVRSFFRFDVHGVLFPTWLILGLRLDLYASLVSVGDLSINAFLLSLDAGGPDLSAIFADLDSSGAAVQFDVTEVIDQTDPYRIRFEIPDSADPAGIKSLANTGVFAGHISVGVMLVDEGTNSDGIAIQTSEDTVAIQLPKLVIDHRKLADDFNVIPGDLRHGNLLQAVHEYQQRKQPGVLSVSQRGISVASGAGLKKPSAEILPAVEAIAKSYRLLY